MNDTTIASKAKAQLAGFMGKVFTHFSKPARRFVEECIYGIQASGDTKLSSVVRAIDDDIRPIYTEKRLSRNLDDETLETSIADACGGHRTASRSAPAGLRGPVRRGRRIGLRGRETMKSTSPKALQPLFSGMRRISALKKWVNSRKV